MKILFLHRAKNFGFSFEELFATIKQNLNNCSITDFYDKTYPSFWKNLREIKNIDCDVIHITGGVGYYSLFLPTNKTILTIHDTNHYEHDLKGLKKWLYGLLIYRLPIKNVKYVTTVSEHTKKNLIRFFNIKEEKIKVIPNCYPSEFKPSKKESFSAPPKVLQIGTKPNKNIKRLIQAIKGLNLELTIVGKLSLTMKDYLDESGINYCNKVNLSRTEIYKEYDNCDMVAFVSLREGFGLPIIEANAAGKPVITSNLSSMPEVSRDAALIVNPYEINEIKNGIEKILNDALVRSQLVKNGFKNIERYAPKLIAEKYMKLYNELIKTH